MPCAPLFACRVEEALRAEPNTAAVLKTLLWRGVGFTSELEAQFLEEWKL